MKPNEAQELVFRRGFLPLVGRGNRYDGGEQVSLGQSIIKLWFSRLLENAVTRSDTVSEKQFPYGAFFLLNLQNSSENRSMELKGVRSCFAAKKRSEPTSRG